MKESEERREPRHRGKLPVELESGKGITRDFSGSGGYSLKRTAPFDKALLLTDVAVGIKSEEVAKALNSNDCAWDGIVFRNRLLEKDL